MPLPKLHLTVDRDGYSYTFGPTSISAQLDGGATKTRADLFGTTTNISVKWNCNIDDYNYIMAFYRTATKNGSLPFLCDLVLDGADVDEYTVKFVQGTFKLAQQQGLLYVMQAQLEVYSNNPSESDDNTIIASRS
jgi:hypothetical protein